MVEQLGAHPKRDGRAGRHRRVGRPVGRQGRGSARFAVRKFVASAAGPVHERGEHVWLLPLVRASSSAD
eukprot:7382632-Prymnesium_polylepis.1